MKRLLLAGLFASSFAVRAQDIPLFSQKLTNSFMYNPALAGHTFGSATFSYRTNYSGVADAPKNYFLSVHTPFSNHRFGVGANVYQEEVSFLKNTYYSGAFAYHLYFNKFSSLSMGVGAEMNQLRLNANLATEQYIVGDATYERFQNNTGKPDFSFGMMYQNRFFRMGGSVNRLATAWLEPSDKRTLSNYYTTFAQGMIPVRDGQDLLEPYVAYRKFSEINDTFDAGIYYTYNNLITAGAAMRAGNVANFTIAVRPSKYLLVGYSNEIITTPIGGFVGSSNEFTIRYDFNDQNYQKKFRQDYKQSLSYRRKTLNTSTIKRTPGGHTPKQLAKAQKRVAAFSPNTRYQNTKKLSMGKKTSIRKASFNKRKPTTYKSKARKRPSSKRRR
ncbi:MAG: PorP/SprF family type IX secretion system membrane protein [Bacteroidota bacterium]|jgi:type IX secretion system PorP/SprF family membrane protein|nr:PorP/SprF family type IX secretion system membrane protein [Cytophagales bacterium]MCE2956500.1 type IX secretion system membrane protein PorP/SprF [Flammeovirgaceae bacterium]MCZ8069315.1 PorP/SprF family type IX secretion system membrane protein [Cytophagales bacterium]